MRRIHLFLIVAALLAAAACTHEMKTATAADQGKIELEGHEGYGCSWTYSMEYVTEGLSQEVMDKINQTIIESGIGYEVVGMPPVVPTFCLHWVEDIDSEYSAFADEVMPELDEDDEPWMMNWTYSLDGSFSTGCAARHLRTYEVMDDSYTGGAHGSTYNTFFVFDMTTGQRITDADLFKDGYDSEIAGTINDRVLDGLDEELWDAIYEVPLPNGNFSVDEKGLTWHYNPYEIGPYVLGPLSATFTWDELAPYLK